MASVYPLETLRFSPPEDGSIGLFDFHVRTEEGFLDHFSLDEVEYPSLKASRWRQMQFSRFAASSKTPTLPLLLCRSHHDSGDRDRGGQQDRHYGIEVEGKAGVKWGGPNGLEYEIGGRVGAYDDRGNHASAEAYHNDQGRGGCYVDGGSCFDSDRP